jgi:hypothetical protein
MQLFLSKRSDCYGEKIYSYSERIKMPEFNCSPAESVNIFLQKLKLICSDYFCDDLSL